MNKFIVFLLVAVSLLVSLSLSSKATAGKTQSTAVPPRVTPTPSAEILQIELDKYEAVIPCPCFKGRPGVCSPDENGKAKRESFSIAVETVVRNPKNAALEYIYTVSGGKIIGQGDKVTWDLEGLRPGTYTITASIKGKRRVSAETETKSVTIRECDCNCPCACPTLVVSGGGSIKGGETVEFTANVSGGTAPDITYSWTVSQGEIVEGQGTPKIKVKTTSEMTGTITATVEIGSSGLCADCPRTASETAAIVE